MDFVVPPLPYSKDALEPVMSKETLEFHYEKHHKGYMNKLKGLIEGKPEAQKSLVEVIKTSSGGVFNNAAQVWNHTFFWEGMKPGGGGAPPAGDVADLISRDFGGWEKFRDEWIEEGHGSLRIGLRVARARPAVRARSSTRRTPKPRSPPPTGHCSRPTSGSTPTTWITETTVRRSSKCSATSSSTGISSPRT